MSGTGSRWGAAMFAQFVEAGGRRHAWIRGASVALHVILLAIVLRRPEPVFIKPSSLAFGYGGTSTSITYLATDAFARTEAPRTAESLSLPSPSRSPKVAVKKPDVHQAPDTEPKAAPDAALHAERAGSPYGTLAQGPASGEDVRPALPVAFADPRVPASELPAGLQGRVVVEITIDEQGNITETKVVQTLGYGLEEKVLTALQKWHFRPATRFGVPIASKQYVSFYFPS